MGTGNVPLTTPSFKLTTPKIRQNNPDIWEHWKYPETIGGDTGVDDINFNSDATSEYAKLRSHELAPRTKEPFIMFEFMKVDNDDFGQKTSMFVQEKGAAMWGGTLSGAGEVIIDKTAGVAAGTIVNTIKSADAIEKAGGPSEPAKDLAERVFNKVKEWAQSIGTLVKRKYTGSIALYMPTDIQINDQLIYNEDTRKIGAIFESMLNKEKGDWDVWNPTVMTDPTVTTAIGAIAGKFAPFGLGSNTSAAVTAFATYGIGDILQTELQRATGQVVNPNELLRYASTALRTFTFNWTFLPDSEDESKQVTGLIKLFRRSAHAKRDSSTLIIVPDHCIVSFHGAADMVQVPPCYIESVNVNYNPNNSSFFIEGNRPVEIKMSVTLKEIVPVYQHNIDEGY